MGYFVKVNGETIKTYEAVSDTAFKAFVDFASHVKFQKITKLGKSRFKEIYFDTPNHLLNKSGIVLSKIVEGSNSFIKVENATFLSKMLNKLEKEVFVHKVGIGDDVADHAFFIKDGITSMFSTAFSIDLENVIKNAEPKMEVLINSQIYQLTSGTGMRAKIALEIKTIKNKETKRVFKVEGLTVKLENENKNSYLEDFEKFNQVLQKNCKEFLEINENQFDFATRVTKPIIIEAKEKLTKEQKKKQNKIEG